MTLHSALCRTSTINLKTCFYMVIPVWEKPFFHTASPESFSDPPTVSCTFPPTIFFDMMAANSFSRKDTGTDEELIYDCDLLIIDDLGTELTNSFVSSQLFLCLNERIMRRKSTIISTNLTLKNFSDTYSERTFSRIASNYQMISLIGKDIRIQKIFLGGN